MHCIYPFKGTKSHSNADGLLRLPLPNTEHDDTEVDGTHVFMTEQFENLPVTCKEVRHATASDPVLSRIYDNVMNGWINSEVEVNLKPFDTRKLELSAHQVVFYAEYV